MEANYGRQALLEFIEMLEAKGLANHNTASSLKISAGKILGDLSSEEENDVRLVDVELAVKKFNNRNPNQLSPKSLAEYQRRTELAIREFVRFHDNPTGYTGFGRGPQVKGEGGAVRREKTRTEKAPDDLGAGTTPPSQTGLSLAFPLRADFLAQVVIPRDLKSDEAKRLAMFISTLAIDYKPD